MGGQRKNSLDSVDQKDELKKKLLIRFVRKTGKELDLGQTGQR
jgi:hypothetical protein